MSGQSFDAITRRAAGVSRRDSFLTMGGAGLAAMAIPTLTAADKSDKKARKRARKTAKKKCKKQVGQCEGFIANLCAGERGEETCVARLSPCCEFLAQCQVTAMFDCIFANAV